MAASERQSCTTSRVPAGLLLEASKFYPAPMHSIVLGMLNLGDIDDAGAVLYFVFFCGRIKLELLLLPLRLLYLWRESCACCWRTFACVSPPTIERSGYAKENGSCSGCPAFTLFPSCFLFPNHVRKKVLD